MTPDVEFVELIRDVAMRDGPTIPAGTVGYVVGVTDPYVRVRWPSLDAAAMHAPADLRPSTESAWEAGRAVSRTHPTPPLLSRGELMELDVDRLVEKILGLRGDIADDAEEMATLRATIATLTAERDAALSRATAAEARGAEVRAEALREAAASEASELAARDAAMRGTLAAPSLATMRALHRAGGCWLVSYDDDDSGDPVVTIEYFDRARSLAEKEGDNPVRWVAVDLCGRVCLPPQGDAAEGAL